MKLLDDVIQWYRVTQDSHRVVSSLMESNPESFPPDVVFATKSPQDALPIIQTALKELDDLVILSLVSIFEKTVLYYLVTATQNASRVLLNPFERAAVKYAVRSPDRWHFQEVLDLFKSIVDNPQVVSDVKQVVHYRNWVAHGKKEEEKHCQIILDPITAHIRLTEFLKRAELV